MDHTRAVVFDMDGVLIDSGSIWERIIGEFFADYQVALSDLDQEAFAGGDNSRQWASYLRRNLGMSLSEEEIIDRVVSDLLAAYADEVPLLPGAAEALSRLSAVYPLALASSSPRAVIAYALERSGLLKLFSAWVSSDDVARGKPAPDVYLEACARLGVPPECCVAVEDSRFGVRAAKTAGLRVVAIPQRSVPLDEASLSLADRVLDSIVALSPRVVHDVLTSKSIRWRRHSGRSGD